MGYDRLKDLLTPVAQQITEITGKVSGPLSDMSFQDRAHIFVELSILAYCNKEQASKWAIPMGFTDIGEINPYNDQVALIFSNDTDIVVAFRGTYNLHNVVEDAEVKLSKDGNLPGKIHEGFLEDFDALWPDIVPLLNGHKTIWATGHSLGGAMAAVMAVRASRREGPNLAGLYTFGQPRIGDAAYTANIDTPSFRWVNHLDIVPRVPPFLLNYRHFGQQLYIDSDGNVYDSILMQTVKQLWDFMIGILGFSLEDHIIFNYRDAILKK